MPQVVFLRGVNVGGHKKFQPSVLAKELADFDVVSVGAAGTFVVRKSVGQKELKAAVLQKLPFDAELMICTEREIAALTGTDAFADVPESKDCKRYVTVLAKRLSKIPSLPLSRPPNDEWQVQVIGVTGKFALSVWRRQGKRLIYPNEVIEKEFGVAATTRNWNTITAIWEIVSGS
jgi:uncharacterized protein (DUF1697 family)